MKWYFVGIMSFALMAACSGAKEKTVAHKSYGPYAVDESKAVSVAEMLSDFAQNGQQEKEYTVEGKIEEVCAKAGCWIHVDKGNGETFMVRFKDHFTIPTDTKSGTVAVLHGRAFVDTVSVELLRHFAEDAEKSKEEIEKITEPKVNFGFEADGIRLR